MFSNGTLSQTKRISHSSPLCGGAIWGFGAAFGLISKNLFVTLLPNSAEKVFESV